MSKIFWYLIHSFRFVCPDSDIEAITKNWNPRFPEIINPRHICKKCGREFTRGIVYSDEPWPPPPSPKL